MQLFPAIVLLSILVQSCIEKRSDAKVFDLACENLLNPDGIGTSEPGLSWKIDSDRNGISQEAYQVLVASDTSLLNEKDSDLWNSGKIKSPFQILVKYGGKQLDSRSACVWKVRIWDEMNKTSEWSPVSKFSIGLLNESDWKAEYIMFKNNSEKSASPQFHRSFEISEHPSRIFLYVNSLGYHEVYLNGKKVSNMVLAPAVAQFSKRSQVIAYDVTTGIKSGKNDLVIWAGRGWYAPGLPGVVTEGPVVRAQMDVLKNNEWNTLIKTDTTWKARPSGYYTLGTWKPGEFGGEAIDASMLLPDLTEASLKTTDWQSVITVSIPGHKVTAQLTEGNIITDTLKALSVTKTGSKKWMADIGTTLTGLTEIRFSKLKKGQRIELQFCDHLDKDGKPVDQGQTDYYTASGIPDETFRNRFNYHGYRYIIINNLDSEPHREDISAYPVRTGYSLAASFECSDPDMNSIHDMIFYTLQNLSLGGYLVDCPQIERLGYGGDGNASTETAQTMFDLAPLYRNWLQAWGDCLREDGGMPHTAPNPYPAGGGPYWCGFVITASWRTYMNYGDKRILEKYYPVMQKWISYADKYSPSGLLEPWPETDYRSWYLGDWASPEGTDHTDTASIKLVNNCFMAVCFETMQKIALTLGKKDEAEDYAERRLSIIELINSDLYYSNNKIYGSGIQIDLTYPLLAGVVPDSLKNEIRKKLLDEIEINHNGHISTGLVGIPVFTEWAIRNGESDLMYSMLKKREYPGYLFMIDNGATTTWEHWNGARSRIHNCYNGIGAWFYQAVGGICQEENSQAYGKVIIDPQIPDGITWANTSKETPYGTVEVKWTLGDGVIRIDIGIPVGCTARIVIPEDTEKITLNGKIIDKISSFLEIESGKYNLFYNIIPQI